MLNIFKRSKQNIYLDHAGATPVSPFVLSKIRELDSIYANPSAIYKSGVKARAELHKASKLIAYNLNCHDDEIIYTASGTESSNLALLGYIKSLVLKRKALSNINTITFKVITTPTEHASVLEPLRHLESMGLVEIIYLAIDETGNVNINELRDIIKRETDIALVTIMYANNETGRVMPVKEIGRIIDLHNNEKKNLESKNYIAYHIDACQAVNYLDIDIKKLRVDMMSLNSSKIYGPKGVAMLFKRRGIELSPIIYGGGQERGLRSGTENLGGIAALAYALDQCIKNRSSEVKRLLALQEYFVNHIVKIIPELKVYTCRNEIHKIVNYKNGEDKINYFNIESLPNNINIGLPGMSSDEMVVRLSEAGYEVSHKSACASDEVGEGSYVLRAMGASEQEANENIRITMGRSTKLKDMQNLAEIIKEIYYEFKV